MQAENVKEYKLIRDEMHTVKDCITKYIGYVLGGSGAAIYGMARMDQSTINNFQLTFVSVSLSIIISFILMILFYKFSSHNRFAGYCKVLNHERYDLLDSSYFMKYEFKEPLFVEELCSSIIKDNNNNIPSLAEKTIDQLNELLEFPKFYDVLIVSKPSLKFSENIKGLVDKTQRCREKNWSDLYNEEQNDIKRLNRLLLEETYPTQTPKRSKLGADKETAFFAWEMAVEKLRYSDMEPKSLLSTLNDVKIKDLKIERLGSLLEKYAGREPQIDDSKLKKGCKIIKSALFGKIETRSWAFPPLVTGMFFVLSLGFLVAGCCLTIKEFSTKNPGWYISILFLAIGSIAQFYIWRNFIGKIYALMNGSETIHAYFWKFIPVRASFLNSYNITPSYLEANKLLEEALQIPREA